MPATRAKRTQTERREQTRAELIDAAIRCVGAHGYRAATTRQVAQAAGVSLGALAHHFPSRMDLMTAALEEVGRRGARDLRGRAASMDTDSDTYVAEVLDLLWSFFDSDLFTVWIRVWLAAAEDEMLNAKLAPIETRLNETLAETVAALAPSHISAAAWRRRVRVAIHAIRGLVLSLKLEPRELQRARDPWPATRRELIALINRPV